MQIKKVTIQILKKGRKYFDVCYPGCNPFKMVINEISQGFEVGQTIENLRCSFEYQEGYKGHGKTFATPVTQQEAKEIKEAERQSEIKRWCEYTEKHLSNGIIYKKGFDKLKTLGFDTSIYQEQIEQIEVKRWSGYCEEKALQGYVYQRGIDELIKLGRKDLADNYRQQAKQNKEQQKIKEYEEKPKTEKCGEMSVEKNNPELIRWSYDSSVIGIVSEGDIIHKWYGTYSREYGEWVKVLDVKTKYFRYDGLSFGLRDDSGTLVSVTARIATDEEAAPAIAKAKELELKELEIERQEKERKNLINHIKQHGTRPFHSMQEKLKASGECREGWFEIDEKRCEIWYCEYNLFDGDCWGDNNVFSGEIEGARWGNSMGWRIEYTEEIASRINALPSE